MDAKACTKCGVEKDESEFALHGVKRYPDYRRPYCKGCGTVQSDAWRKAHQVRNRFFQERYREKRRGNTPPPLPTRMRPGEKAVEFTAQPYEDWKRWRFSSEFMRLEDELGGVNTWKAMHQLCAEGVAPQAAAEALCQTATRTAKSAAKWKVIRHPWDTN